MNTLKDIQQIKALTIKLNKGSASNKFALKNKIKKLKKQIDTNYKKESWQNYLAQ